MENNIERELREFREITVAVVNELPILEQLEFAKNIVFLKTGTLGEPTRDAALMMAVSVMKNVIDVLKLNPRVARICMPGGLRVPKGLRVPEA